MDESDFAMGMDTNDDAERGVWRRLSSRRTGAGSIEYLLILGACSLAGLIGFKNFGSALRSDLENEGQLIVGKGTPNLAPPNIVKAPGGLKPYLDGFVPPGVTFPACGVKGCTTCSPPGAVGGENVASSSFALGARSAAKGNQGSGEVPGSNGCAPDPATPPSVVKLSCGDTGSYREMFSDEDTRRFVPRSEPQNDQGKREPYHRDHIPAKETLWLRAQNFIDDKIESTRVQSDFCPTADKECVKKQATAEMNQEQATAEMNQEQATAEMNQEQATTKIKSKFEPCKKSGLNGLRADIYREICLDGPVMILPAAFHRAGRTWGNAFPGDANNIPNAVSLDIQRYREVINKFPEKLGNCNPAEVQDALDRYEPQEWDSGRFDDLIRGAVERSITEKAGDFVRAVQAACEACGSMGGGTSQNAGISREPPG